MSLSPELSLLVACLRPAPSADPPAGPVDGDRFVDLARRHGVSPLASHALERCGGAGLSETARAELRGDFERNAPHVARLAMELAGVAGRLEDRGITVAPFKGAAIAESAYGSVWLRQFSDIDLLVPPERVVEARRVLAECGYRLVRRLSAEQEARQVAESPFAYSFTLQRDGGHLTIDLHWRLAEQRHPAYPGVLHEPWGRLVPRGRAWTFRPEDMLLLLSAHAAKHAWERLRWFCDIAWLLDREGDLDWGAALGAAVESGPVAERTLLVSLRLVETLFRAPLAAEATARIQRDAVVGSVADELTADFERRNDDWPMWLPRGFHSDALFLRLAQTPGRKARYFLRFCVYRVAAPDAKDREAVALPGRLSFLYYLLRPFRLLRDYGLTPVRAFVALLPRLLRSA